MGTRTENFIFTERVKKYTLLELEFHYRYNNFYEIMKI